MSNILDYLRWRGDLEISSSVPFNEVDALILARISYLPLDEVDLASEESIESVAAKLSEVPEEHFEKRPDDQELVKALAESERFKNLKVTDYEKEVTAQGEESQFAAVTVHLDEREMYLSFIGTDDTMVGWREDLNMSFMECVPGQEKALAYADRVLKKFPLKNFYLGGHSKGGNEALYCAMKFDEGTAERLIMAHSFDGPGFLPEVMESITFAAPKDKLSQYVPQGSIVGRLMIHPTDPIVVRSTGKGGIGQHNLYTWEVARTSFERGELTDGSNAAFETVSNFLRQSTPEERELLVSEVFEILEEKEVTTTRELADSLKKHLPSYIKIYRAKSEEERKGMLRVIGLFGKSYAEAFLEQVFGPAKEEPEAPGAAAAQSVESVTRENAAPGAAPTEAGEEHVDLFEETTAEDVRSLDSIDPKGNLEGETE